MFPPQVSLLSHLPCPPLRQVLLHQGWHSALQKGLLQVSLHVAIIYDYNLKVKTIYPQGKEPKYELFSSLKRIAVSTLVYNYAFFWIFLTGLGNVTSPSSSEQGLCWASIILSSNLSIEWRRRNDNRKL